MSELGFLFLFILICSTSVYGDRKDIQHMMYDSFKNAAMCFRVLNGTHQFGCSTPQSGKSGVVHIVNSEADVDWLLQSSKAGPYMAVVPSTLFTRKIMKRLGDSPHVSGVLLALNDSAERPANLSPDDTCPNRYASLSGSCDDKEPWNPLGQGFLQEDWTISLFTVKDTIILQQIKDCFEKFNLPLDDSQVERSLCSLQMTGHMHAAVDTPTCLRRNSFINTLNPITYCDPMGDQNVVYHLFPRQDYHSALENSVILVTTRHDVAAVFDGLSPGAVTAVNGFVTLLATAYLMSRILPQYKETYTKNVVFALLNGESYEYIGSSRIVYDIQQGKFPSPDMPLKLEHLDQVIDINQLDLTKHIYCHCLSSSTAQNTVSMLKKSGKALGVSVEGSCTSQGTLPPSSLHSFLKANKSIPGVILTNHASQYTNMFFNGVLDDTINAAYSNISKSLPSSLAAFSHSLAQTLAQLVDKDFTWPVNVTIENTTSLVDTLLHCYLVSRQCDLFREVAGTAVVGDGEGPLPLYVGVSKALNQVTSASYYTLANLTGHPTNITQDQCNDFDKADSYSYIWVSGDNPDSGVCLKTGIILTPAVSPAFSIENYDWTSHEFSSFTESVWQELGLRMFLRPSFGQELSTLICGLVVLFLSFTSVYWIKRNADQLFNPLAQEETDSTILLGSMNTSTYGCMNM